MVYLDRRSEGRMRECQVGQGEQGRGKREAGGSKESKMMGSKILGLAVTQAMTCCDIPLSLLSKCLPRLT